MRLLSSHNDFQIKCQIRVCAYRLECDYQRPTCCAMQSPCRRSELEGDSMIRGRQEGPVFRAKIVAISPILGHIDSFESLSWSSFKSTVTFGHENILKQVKYIFPTSPFL